MAAVLIEDAEAIEHPIVRSDSSAPRLPVGLRAASLRMLCQLLTRRVERPGARMTRVPSIRWPVSWRPWPTWPLRPGTCEKAGKGYVLAVPVNFAVALPCVRGATVAAAPVT